jgi:hypothetical protein
LDDPFSLKVKNIAGGLDATVWEYEARSIYGITGATRVEMEGTSYFAARRGSPFSINTGIQL